MPPEAVPHPPGTAPRRSHQCKSTHRQNRWRINLGSTEPLASLLQLWNTADAYLFHWPLSHLLSGAAASFSKQALPGKTTEFSLAVSGRRFVDRGKGAWGRHAGSPSVCQCGDGDTCRFCDSFLCHDSGPDYFWRQEIKPFGVATD